MRTAVDHFQSAGRLAELIGESLVAGHRKVALQRIFMLRGLCGGLSADLAAVAEREAARLSMREVRRMRRAAEAWVSMLGVRAR